jgi:hypothetical protein
MPYLTRNPSLHTIDIFLCLARDGDSHAEDVHHDPLRGGLWPQAYPDASPWRRARVWRHWRRGCNRAAGEDCKGGGQEESTREQDQIRQTREAADASPRRIVRHETLYIRRWVLLVNKIKGYHRSKACLRCRIMMVDAWHRTVVRSCK